MTEDGQNQIQSQIQDQDWREVATICPADDVNGDDGDQHGPIPESRLSVEPPELETAQEGIVGEAGLDTLGGGMRKMVELVNKLRAAGIEGLGLGLPRIAVVGNQSAGKSSLIEAISGIKVPRYTGTCTRCPLEINLSEPEDPQSTWKCSISIRFNKRYSPRRASNNPWVDQPVEQHLFLELSSKNQVEGALMRAQSAVLNPSKRWKEFTIERQDTGGGIGDDFEVKFSPNVVCLEIIEPGLPNLAFIDLPGVIQTTESEREDYLIDLVTNLVKEYVKEDDCLILLAMTMKDDAVNQSAARLAREMGEERTIGALTKPDTVCPGEFQQWIEILRGKAHKLKHGYFVTKQPSQDQLLSGITHAQARQAEHEFFEKKEPWAGELADISYRFGTVALTKYLAEKLGETIRLRLPGIVETIGRQAESVQAELESFPPPTVDNHFFLIQHLLAKFGHLVGEYIQGGHGLEKNKLQMGLKQYARDLAKDLDSLGPDIKWLPKPDEEDDAHLGRFGSRERLSREETPTPSRRGGGGELSNRVISLVDDSEDEAHKKRFLSTPRKSLFIGSSTTPLAPISPPPSTKKRSRSSIDKNSSNSHIYTLRQMNRVLESHSGGQIPDQVDSKAIEFVAQNSLAAWDSAIHTYLDSCQHLLLSIVHAVFVKKFDRYQKTPLFNQSFHIIETFLTGCFEREVDIVMNRIYKLEKEQIATLNEATFKQVKSRHLEVLRESRARNREEQIDYKRQKLSSSTHLTAKVRAALERKLAIEEKGSDKFENELGLMAGVRAYYELASTRFVDNVFISVLGEWVKTVKERLEKEVSTGLGFPFKDGEGEERCRALLEEDPEKERRKRGLEVKMEQLRRAMEELKDL